MLTWTNFKNAMKALVLLHPSSSGATSEGLRCMYEIMKDDFEDGEFKKIAIQIGKKAKFFPIPADFYALKQRPDIPTEGDLLFCYLRKREGGNFTDLNIKLFPWLEQVMKYFTGKTYYNWREITEEEYDWFCRDFSIAYDRFLKDYEAGKGIRIDYSEIPALDEPRTGSTQIGNALNSILHDKNFGGGGQ